MSLSFPLKATKTEVFEPPPNGIHGAICVKVSEPEILEGDFGPRAVIRLTFEIAAKRKDGRRHRLTRVVGASLHPKSSLTQILDRWLGRSPESFEPSLILGRLATLVVHHVPSKDGSVFAKIADIQRFDQDFPLGFQPEENYG